MTKKFENLFCQFFNNVPSDFTPDKLTKVTGVFPSPFLLFFY